MKIYSLALDAVSAVHEDVSPMLAAHDAELANHLHRAIRSVALNVSEGLGLLGGKRQRHHFQIALSGPLVRARPASSSGWRPRR